MKSLLPFILLAGFCLPAPANAQAPGAQAPADPVKRGEYLVTARSIARFGGVGWLCQKRKRHKCGYGEMNWIGESHEDALLENFKARITPIIRTAFGV